MTDQEFRLRADESLDELQQHLLPLADENDLEIELNNGVLQLVFEEPAPAKFVVSPNLPVRQVWLSAMLRSFKLSWSNEASAFVLDGETLSALLDRLVRQQLGVLTPSHRPAARSHRHLGS